MYFTILKKMKLMMDAHWRNVGQKLCYRHLIEYKKLSWQSGFIFSDITFWILIIIQYNIDILIHIKFILNTQFNCNSNRNDMAAWDIITCKFRIYNSLTYISNLVATYNLLTLAITNTWLLQLKLTMGRIFSSGTSQGCYYGDLNSETAIVIIYSKPTWNEWRKITWFLCLGYE